MICRAGTLLASAASCARTAGPLAWLGLLLVGILMLAVSAAPIRAQDLPPEGLLDFAVMRNGEEIGYHRVSFQHDGSTTTMEVEAKVELTLLGLTIYRFFHRGREHWTDGVLREFETVTDDDGDPWSVATRRNGAGDFTVHNGEGEAVVMGDSVPSSLWHLGILQARARDELLHTITGKLLPMTVTALGRRPVETATGPIDAEGYFVDARPDFHRELWYDEAGLLAAAMLTGDDGSAVKLVRRSPVTVADRQ